VSARQADDLASRPRPRPVPASSRKKSSPPRRRPGRGLALPEPVQNGQVVAAAGGAIVTAARVGRLLGRSGWRIAKQLPGVSAVEQQAQRLRQAATAELGRLLDVPQNLFTGGSPEDQRVMMLVQNAGTDPEPLRTAMSELLDRSAGGSGGQGREYLFGTIVSQLVPDEARILAVLSADVPFAAVDVVAKQVGRSTTRIVLANISPVGSAAGVAVPENTATYLARLHGFGLIEFGPPGDDLGDQFTALQADPKVTAAKARIERDKLGSSKIVRKRVTLSPLGREFWSACAPRA
jgi:hypothetical protein